MRGFRALRALQILFIWERIYAFLSYHFHRKLKSSLSREINAFFSFLSWNSLVTQTHPKRGEKVSTSQRLDGWNLPNYNIHIWGHLSIVGLSDQWVECGMLQYKNRHFPLWWISTLWSQQFCKTWQANLEKLSQKPVFRYLAMTTRW